MQAQAIDDQIAPPHNSIVPHKFLAIVSRADRAYRCAPTFDEESHVASDE
jgi:hypothetical protein